MSGVIRSSACFVLMGGGRLELGIVQGNVALKKKKRSYLCSLLFYRSCMPPFACILQT